MRLRLLACAAALAAPGALTVTHGALAGAEPGRWAFEPPRDEFSEDALFDLRSLNEKEAGRSGLVKRSRDGNEECEALRAFGPVMKLEDVVEACGSG